MAQATRLLGAPIAARLRESVSRQAAELAARGAAPCLAVVLASDDPASLSYAETKRRAAEKLGITMRICQFDPTRGQIAFEDMLGALNADVAVHGILIELPLAQGLDADAALALIDPHKDVDGLTPANMGLIASGREAAALVSATPLACISLAESVTAIAGRQAVVVGRGRTVGRTLAAMLINRDATVTVCHSRTVDLAETVRRADLVFCAVGKAGLIGAPHLRQGQVVIDAGTSMAGDQLAGDLDAAAADGVVAAFSPVPGGVGPVTTATLFANLLRAIEMQGRAGLDPR